MAILSWLGSLLKKNPNSGNNSSGVAPLPGLPTGTVAAVASTLTEAGRIIEQQTNLHNTPAVQQGKISVEQQEVKDKINEAISKDDIDTERKLWS